MCKKIIQTRLFNLTGQHKQTIIKLVHEQFVKYSIHLHSDQHQCQNAAQRYEQSFFDKMKRITNNKYAKKRTIKPKARTLPILKLNSPF